MPRSCDTLNENLREADQMVADDIIVGYDGRNLRSRAFKASTMESYFKSRLSVIAILFDDDSGVITVTNGDGTKVVGTVT